MCNGGVSGCCHIEFGTTYLLYICEYYKTAPSIDCHESWKFENSYSVGDHKDVYFKGWQLDAFSP